MKWVTLSQESKLDFVAYGNFNVSKALKQVKKFIEKHGMEEAGLTIGGFIFCINSSSDLKQMEHEFNVWFNNKSTKPVKYPIPEED